MSYNGAVSDSFVPSGKDGGAGNGVPVPVVAALVALTLLPSAAASQSAPDSARAADSVALIAPVVISAVKPPRSELDAVGFTARKRQGVGRFMVRAEIERRQPRTISGIFRNIPGFRVGTTNSRSRVQGTRGGGCMTYFIDNNRYSPVLGTDIDDALPISEVAAIEVYTVATTPAEYSTGTRGLCNTVVIWTRARTEDRRRTSSREP